MFAWQYILTAIALAVAYYVFFRRKFDPKSIRGKRVLVTGASSGIGEELAYEYSKLGASVMITARREAHLQKVAAKCKQLGAEKIEYVTADMAVAEHRKKLVDEVEKRFGGLDQLVLNHALFIFETFRFTSEDVASLQNVMEINFFSFVDITSRCIKMLKESHGSIGVVSSVAGKYSGSLSAYYSTSKFALDGYFSAIREELSIYQEKVSVTLFLLGYVKTEVAAEIGETIFTGITPPAVEVSDTAAVIVKGITMRENEVYYPIVMWYVVMFGRAFPHILNYILNIGVKMALRKRNLL